MGQYLHSKLKASTGSPLLMLWAQILGRFEMEGGLLRVGIDLSLSPGRMVQFRVWNHDKGPTTLAWTE